MAHEEYKYDVHSAKDQFMAAMHMQEGMTVGCYLDGDCLVLQQRGQVIVFPTSDSMRSVAKMMAETADRWDAGEFNAKE